MRFFLVLIIGFITTLQQDSNPVKVYWQERAGKVNIFVQNDNLYPITIEFDAKPENLIAADRLPVTETVGASSNHKIFYFQIKNPAKKWDYEATYKYYKGDIYARHNDKMAYKLPFKSGESYPVTQGYNGQFSHKGDLKYSIDFYMDSGTSVYAARSGVVIEAEDRFDKGGPLEQFMPYTNYITVLHDDGTFSEYSHLKQNGVLVEVGQHIFKGQHIAYSGATGFASGPHLHFVVKKAKKGGGFVSIPIKFATQEGVIELEEGISYVGY